MAEPMPPTAPDVPAVVPVDAPSAVSDAPSVVEDDIAAEPAMPAMAARGVSKAFGGVHAVEDVTLEFPFGSVTAVVGDNGAGKTTFIKMLSGVLQPDAGTIEIDGQPVRLTSPAVARQAGIETVHQDLALADLRDVSENLFMGREMVRRIGPIGVLDRGGMRQETIRILEELNVNLPTIRQQVRKLSGGQRQAIAIGRAVHWGSRILIMDEPMAALGLQEAGRVQELIAKLAQRGLTQIIVSHNLEHVFSLSTRIAIMRLGRLVAVLPTAETDHEEVVRLVAGLTSRSSAATG